MNKYPVIEISEFIKPTDHPWGMLEEIRVGKENTFEIESFLAWMLIKAIDAGKFDWVQCRLNHDEVVKEGLLESNGPEVYRLSNKAIELLHKYYGRGNEKSN